jgi:hypothetical protein
MPRGTAQELSGEGFVRVVSYEQIYERIISGIPTPASARPDAETEAGATPTDVDSVTDGATDADGAADIATDADGATDADSVADAIQTVAGLSLSSLEVSNERGYVYRAEGEYVEVLDEVTGGRTQEINLYDCVSLGGEAICVTYRNDTLAVLYVSNEGIWRNSSDYALAAYGASRSLVLLFDASVPARLVFEVAIGIVGVPLAVRVDGDTLVVATHHKAVPDVDENGQWILEGKTAEEVSAYRGALALRVHDEFAWVPSFYADGELVALLPEQIYLSGWGSATTTTVVASFVLSERLCTSLFAFYDPGVLQAGSSVQINSDSFVFDYVVDYQGAPAVVSVQVPVGPNGLLDGIGKVSWAER